MTPDAEQQATSPDARLAAIVMNPIKGTPEHWREVKRSCNAAAKRAGWQEPLWIETTADDPGRGQAREAVEAGADIVFAAGGDGTVRNVGGALMGTDVPLGLIPSGTGNLLARNLGVPHISSAGKAFASTLEGGRDVRIDVGVVNAHLDDGEVEDIFLIMAGFGLDGDIMDTTSERLKAAIGWLAYPMAGAKFLWQRPENMIATFDDGAPITKKTTSLLFGNFGRLTGGVKLMPEAVGDDSELDAVWLSADGPKEWAGLTRNVMLGSRKSTDQVLRQRTRHGHAKALGEPRALELDGDVVGRATEIDVTLKPLALTVRIPAESTHRQRQRAVNAFASLTRRR